MVPESHHQVALMELPHVNGHLAAGRFHLWPSADVVYLAPLGGGSTAPAASASGSSSGRSPGAALGCALVEGCDTLSVGAIAAKLRAAAEQGVARAEPYAAARQKVRATLSRPAHLFGNLFGNLCGNLCGNRLGGKLGGGGGLGSGSSSSLGGESSRNVLLACADAILGWLSSVGVDILDLGVKKWPCGTCCVLAPPSDSGVEVVKNRRFDIVHSTSQL